MAKGDAAKSAVVTKLAEVFGEDWIGESNKKYYVWAKDGNEKVQISITLACPKTMVGAAPTTYVGAGLDFEAMGQSEAPKPTAAEISPEETAKIEELMRKLNL